MAADRPLISVSEAARLLGVTQSTGYRWLAAGELPGAVRLGGRWYCRRRVLEAFLAGTDDAAVAQPAAGPRLRAVG